MEWGHRRQWRSGDLGEKMATATIMSGSGVDGQVRERGDTGGLIIYSHWLVWLITPHPGRSCPDRKALNTICTPVCSGECNCR